MTADLRELYQEIILDHARSPRNTGALDEATGKARGNNPLCGDRITVWVRTDGDCVEDLSFEAKGCAISVASASMMTLALKGQTLAEARRRMNRFLSRVTGKETCELCEMDELSALMGVRSFPTRVKCATLPWHALEAALQGDEGTEVTTE